MTKVLRTRHLRFCCCAIVDVNGKSGGEVVKRFELMNKVMSTVYENCKRAEKDSSTDFGA
jgi:hypothetical protein